MSGTALERTLGDDAPKELEAEAIFTWFRPAVSRDMSTPTRSHPTNGERAHACGTSGQIDTSRGSMHMSHRLIESESFSANYPKPRP